MVNNESHDQTPEGANLPSSEVHGAEHLPQPSFWPLVTALTTTITLAGALVSPVMVVVGLALTLAAIVAWSVEGGHK